MGKTDRWPRTVVLASVNAEMGHRTVVRIRFEGQRHRLGGSGIGTCLVAGHAIPTAEGAPGICCSPRWCGVMPDAAPHPARVNGQI